MQSNLISVVVKTHYKKVTDEKNSRFGQTRPAGQFSFQFESLGDSAANAAVQEILSQFGKKLIAANSDWNYSPAAEEITLLAWHADFTAETTRTREITTAKLKAFAEVYRQLAIKYLGKTNVVAAAGASVVANKFRDILGNNAALNAMKANFDSLVLAVADSADSSVLDEHEAVFNKLNEILDESLAVKFTAEML